MYVQRRRDNSLLDLTLIRYAGAMRQVTAGGIAGSGVTGNPEVFVLFLHVLPVAVSLVCRLLFTFHLNRIEPYDGLQEVSPSR